MERRERTGEWRTGTCEGGGCACKKLRESVRGKRGGKINERGRGRKRTRMREREERRRKGGKESLNGIFYAGYS